MEIDESYEVGKRINGKMQIYVKVIARKDGEYYLGKWTDRKRQPCEFSQLQDVKLIPSKNRSPVLQPHWTVVPDGNFPYYIKRPSLEDCLDPGLEVQVEHEIQMCELVRQPPHPRLATYHGAVVVQGRVSGLAFEKYETTLLERVNPQRLSKHHFAVSGRPLVQDDMKRWLEALRGAVEHLHCMDLVHNDITPANVMLDRDESPVIIDLGELCRVGDALEHTKRTRGWHDESVTHSAKENDLDALAELEVWLFGSVGDFRFAE